MMVQRKRNTGGDADAFYDDETTTTTNTPTSVMMDLPQGISDAHVASLSKAEMRSQSRLNNPASWAWIVSFTMVLSVCVGGYVWLLEYEVPKLRQTIERDEIVPLTQEYVTRYHRLSQEHETLQDVYATLSKNHTDLLKSSAASEEQCDADYNLVQSKLSDIQESIQKYSQKVVLAKYGPEPYHVEIQVAFDPNGPTLTRGSESDTVLVLKLAPLDQMPHSVHHFLEQVSQGLYDGCSFHRNAHHVLQGGPAPNFLTPPDAKSLRSRFKEAGLLHVMFQEYNEEFPHEEYTVGYARRYVRIMF
jgi:hypothetical protein